jgi:hypothetical protein
VLGPFRATKSSVLAPRFESSLLRSGGHALRFACFPGPAFFIRSAYAAVARTDAAFRMAAVHRGRLRM